MTDVDEYSVWCLRYLATDPEHAVTKALQVARLALQQRMTGSERYHLLLNTATALCYLGRHQEEVAALRQAKPLAPDPSAIAAPLSRAYAEVGDYRQSRAVRRAWEQCPQRCPAPLALPVLPGLQRSGATAVP